MRPERESRPGDRNGLRSAGLCLVAIGFALATVYAAAVIYRSVSSTRAIQQFDGRRAIMKGRTETVRAEAHTEEEPGPSVWSKNRGIPDDGSSEKTASSPLAVLRFEKQHLRVPVFEGTGELTLSKGAGWIESTSPPGGSGNIGIAGHRDSFFRGLSWTSRRATRSSSKPNRARRFIPSIKPKSSSPPTSGFSGRAERLL